MSYLRIYLVFSKLCTASQALTRCLTRNSATTGLLMIPLVHNISDNYTPKGAHTKQKAPRTRAMVAIKAIPLHFEFYQQHQN